MSPDVRFRPATDVDARTFARLLRDEDRIATAEVGIAPEEALLQSIKMSVGAVWVVTFDERPAVLFGVVPGNLLTGYAVPWMLGTVEIERHPKTFYKLSRSVVRVMRQRYSVIGASIHAGYTRSIRWARHLGFTVEEPKPVGPSGALFCRAIMGGL